MPSIFETVSLSRKYMDLIYKSSNMWPNLTPASTIAVGDYGSFHRKTADFIIAGNIYKEGIADEYGIEKEHECEPENQIRHISDDGVYRSLGADAGPNIPGLQLQFNFSVEFKSGRSALLVLHKPKLIEIKYPGKLKALSNHPKLKGMAIVDRVYTCPAYTQVLTRDKGSKVTVGFAAQIPALTALAMPVGGDIYSKWNVNSTSGDIKTGSGTEYKFYPLYRILDLEKLKYVSRGSSQTDINDEDVEEVERPLPVFEPPWGELDSEGEETFYEGNDTDGEGSASGNPTPRVRLVETEEDA